MGIKLNRKGYEHAQGLIKKGAVDTDTSWEWTTEDENTLLGDPPDYEEYSRWFLGIDDEKDPETKSAYRYPFGKEGKVYRSALIAIRQRSAQQNVEEIYDGAGRLLEKIDKRLTAKAQLIFAEEEKAEVPQEIQILRLGEFVDNQGIPFRVTEEDVQNIVKNAENRINDIVIDYEHQTLKDVEAPAAGWIKRLIDRGKDGLWAVVEWTPRARRYLEQKEYRYLSPVLYSYRQADGYWRPEYLHSVALTNTPAVDGMEPLVNKQGNTNKKEDEAMEKILSALGLERSAKEEEALRAIAVLKEKAQSPTLPREIVEGLGLGEGATLQEVKAEIFALKQKAELSSEVDSLRKELRERKRDELVEHALKEGKITSAQKEWAMKYAYDDPEGFKLFVNKAPQVVPTGSATGDNHTERKGEMDEIQVLVNKQLGIDEETFKKHNTEKEG